MKGGMRVITSTECSVKLDDAKSAWYQLASVTSCTGGKYIYIYIFVFLNKVRDAFWFYLLAPS